MSSRAPFAGLWAAGLATSGDLVIEISVVDGAAHAHVGALSPSFPAVGTANETHLRLWNLLGRLHTDGTLRWSNGQVWRPLAAAPENWLPHGECWGVSPSGARWVVAQPQHSGTMSVVRALRGMASAPARTGTASLRTTPRLALASSPTPSAAC